MSSAQYAVLYDSRSREENEHGMIFTLIGLGENDRMIYKLNPIRDIKNMDERRKAILLPPIISVLSMLFG